MKNSNPALRKRPLLGLKVLYGLRRASKRQWEGGKIYNPDDGGNYNAMMWVENDGTLRVRAYGLAPYWARP